MVSLFPLTRALSDRNELFDKYYEVFPNQNRNAASHRWATYILERSSEMSEKTLRDLFAGFCPVSGSPLSYTRQVLRVEMTLPSVYGGDVSGMMYYCCSPCVCDTQDFIKVDTKTVQTIEGKRQYHFAVIGNPCTNPSAIPPQAPDVNCDQNLLRKATLSDQGHIIIGMFFEPGIEDHSDSSVHSEGQKSFSPMCGARADAGHNSGMGMIFREVAGIAPIVVGQNVTAGQQDMAATAATAGQHIQEVGATTTVTAKQDMTTTLASSQKAQDSNPVSSVAYMRCSINAALVTVTLIALYGL